MGRVEREGVGRDKLLGLNFLIAEFLEKTRGEIGRELQGKPDKARKVLERLHKILYSGRSATDLDEEDIVGTDFKGVVLLYYDWLRPLWEHIEKSISRYKNTVLPMADENRNAAKARGDKGSMQNVDGSALDVDAFADLASMIPQPEFFEDHEEQLSMPPIATGGRESAGRKLAGLLEQAYLKGKETPSAQKLDKLLEQLGKLVSELNDREKVINQLTILPLVKIVFGDHNMKFKDRLNPIEALLDLLDGLPIDIFSWCPECRRCFVKTKVGKENCTQLCAAKSGQRRRWHQDPELAREKERLRYQEKRKGKRKTAPLK